MRYLRSLFALPILFISTPLLAQDTQLTPNSDLIEKARLTPKKNYNHPRHANAQYLCEGAHVFIDFDDVLPFIKINDTRYDIQISNQQNLNQSVIGQNDIVYESLSEDEGISFIPINGGAVLKVKDKIYESCQKIMCTPRAFDF